MIWNRNKVNPPPSLQPSHKVKERYCVLCEMLFKNYDEV